MISMLHSFQKKEPGMGCWGKYDEDDRQALVVQAGYKSKWLQVNATLNSWGSGPHDTRMKRAEKRYFENNILLVSEYVYLKEMYLGDSLTVKILIPVVDSKPIHSSIERDRYCQKH